MPTGQLIKIRCQDEQKRLGLVRNTLPCTLRSSQFPVTHTVVKQRGQRAMNPVWAIMTSMLFNHHVLSLHVTSMLFNHHVLSLHVNMLEMLDSVFEHLL